MDEEIVVNQNKPVWNPAIKGHKITCQGSLAIWQVLRRDKQESKPGLRGKVKLFSDASRFRMLKRVSTIDFSRTGFMAFLTVTYPNLPYPVSEWNWAYHRERMHKEIERITDRRISAVWRTEWLPRWLEWEVCIMVPHHHYLLFNCPYVDKDALKEMWKRIVGWDNYAQVGIEKVETPEKAGHYVSKYVGKSCSVLVIPSYHNIVDFGRQWGVLRPEVLPVHPRLVAEVPDSERMRKMHDFYITGCKLSTLPQSGSFTSLGNKSKLIFRDVFENMLDGEITEE